MIACNIPLVFLSCFCRGEQSSDLAGASRPCRAARARPRQVPRGALAAALGKGRRTR